MNAHMLFICDCCNISDLLFNIFTTHLVDLHSIRTLKEEELALCSDQTGNGVDHFSISTRLSWDLFKKKKII